MFCQSNQIIMKKLLSISWLCVLSSILTFGNIAPPSANINEVTFDSLGDWTIEMTSYDLYGIDSMILISSSGSSIITHFTVIDWGGPGLETDAAVIGDTNLLNPVYIDPEGDYIKLISYSWQVRTDSISFGNYPGSIMDCVNGGESYAFIVAEDEFSFSIDKTPTLGIENDTSGAMASFSGMIYDPEGEPLQGGSFALSYVLSINVNPDGSFYKRVFARRYNTAEITYYSADKREKIYYTIEPLNFCVPPDSTHHEDIITTGFVNITEKEKDYTHGLIVAPNPFNSRLLFYIDYNVVPDDKPLVIQISEQSGQILHTIYLKSGQKRIQWTPASDLAPGIYFYTLQTEKRIYTTGKVIKF